LKLFFGKDENFSIVSLDFYAIHHSQQQKSSLTY